MFAPWAAFASAEVEKDSSLSSDDPRQPKTLTLGLF